MKWDNIEVIPLIKMKLSQAKYKDGFLFISKIIHENELIAIDVRYFQNIENEWLPTRFGFWVPIDRIEELKQNLSEDPVNIGEKPCWVNESRTFFIKYVKEYGGGIDFRYHVKREKFEGWEKKGIRIKESDYKDFRKKLCDVISNPNKALDMDFIIRIPEKKKKKKKSTTEEQKIFINPLLDDLLSV